MYYSNHYKSSSSSYINVYVYIYIYRERDNFASPQSLKCNIESRMYGMAASPPKRARPSAAARDGPSPVLLDAVDELEYKWHADDLKTLYL